MRKIEDLMRMAPVIPVLVIDDLEQAKPLAEALVAGGLRVLEVTLRTDCALDAMRVMAEVEGAIVGAGTVATVDDFKAVQDVGAQFVVSPGLTETVARAAIDADMPLLPGIATASDIMRGMEMGLGHFKFFPAVANGGLPALKALAAPFHKAKFCPTGGISVDTAPEWLAHPQILCVGGSWVAPRGATPAEITKLAKEACGLAR